MPANTNTRVLIRNLPEERLQASDFEVVSSPMPEPATGEVLCQTLAIGIGAGARAGLQAGDLVICGSGWQAYAVHPAKAVSKVSPIDDPAHYVGALGTNGLTAYFGLLMVGEPKPGETVLVSAAAGSVGHLVGQIARIKGARVIGVTGSDDKGQRLVGELGFDAYVNYKDGNFRGALKDAAPKGVDVYFDNTGGDVLGAALFRMNTFGRIACCGVVSQYDTRNPAPGPKGIPGLLVNKRIRMQGFLVFDYADRYAEATQNMLGWMKDGSLKVWQDEFKGLEKAPAAFVDLLAGGNLGTRVVRVSA
jgi:NADPH-dependent curcumin reductase CurA